MNIEFPNGGSVFLKGAVLYDLTGPPPPEMGRAVYRELAAIKLPSPEKLGLTPWYALSFLAIAPKTWRYFDARTNLPDICAVCC